MLLWLHHSELPNYVHHVTSSGLSKRICQHSKHVAAVPLRENTQWLRHFTRTKVLFVIIISRQLLSLGQGSLWPLEVRSVRCTGSRILNSMLFGASPPCVCWVISRLCLHKLWIYTVPTKGVIVFINLSINYTVKIWIIDQNSFKGPVTIYQVKNLQF